MQSNLRVVNAVSNGVISPEWQNPLFSLLETISRSSHHLAANYRLENMDLAGHLSFDLLVNPGGQIVSFSGVYNGGRYPEGVYRILNRTWVAESERVMHGAFPFLTSKLILPVQLEQLSEKLKLVFVSREKPAAKFFLRKWRLQQPDPERWQISENMMQVVPKVNQASCFQYICFKELRPVNWQPVQITELQWEEKFQYPG